MKKKGFRCLGCVFANCSGRVVCELGGSRISRTALFTPGLCEWQATGGFFFFFLRTERESEQFRTVEMEANGSA
ncbi:hypothetical protein KFK09_011511 [Dendrobium nobile]|uniref:Uncharacterized protein n=1 Tax=Dendrobium nobile TaxID=94219 RepID=A0A8T3BF47_DENNO|nr:hypothetical protein KFK09_011511 [Dendrobium nobile]